MCMHICMFLSFSKRPCGPWLECLTVKVSSTKLSCLQVPCLDKGRRWRVRRVQAHLHWAQAAEGNWKTATPSSHHQRITHPNLSHLFLARWKTLVSRALFFETGETGYAVIPRLMIQAQEAPCKVNQDFSMHGQAAFCLAWWTRPEPFQTVLFLAQWHDFCQHTTCSFPGLRS